MKPPNQILHGLLRNAVCSVVILFAGLSWAGPAGVVLDRSHPNVRAAMALQEKITPEILKWPDVLGTAVGINQAGQPDLVVYVEANARSRAKMIEATLFQFLYIPVRTELTDKFTAYERPPGRDDDSQVGDKAAQKPPIPLGTSGGWRSDLANGSCCGGTLGSLIQVNGAQYILSNYHVFESDIVSGGNNLIATTGSPIIQPALIDIRCNAHRARNVGTLVKLSSLPGSNVDVSIAEADPGMVRTDGAILAIGTLSPYTVEAYLNQEVKKSGRTTGLTRSHVSGLNATLTVQYENECAGGEAFTKTFTGQIVIANDGGSFLGSGDSGALMVEDVDTSPRAVGLLFAGNSTSAAANPIDEVLKFVGHKMGGVATMVGD